jgi:two-component system cell cycle response regulator DivK
MANETILIVEDDRLSRKLVETLLQRRGYRLLTATDGKEAIEIATHEQPDLIIMDLRLPKVDGYEATQTLKSQPETAHIPIVALTAQAMPDDHERALAAGCDGYITKPINTRTFPGQVRQHLYSRVSKRRSQ